MNDDESKRNGDKLQEGERIAYLLSGVESRLSLCRDGLQKIEERGETLGDYPPCKPQRTAEAGRGWAVKFNHGGQ